MKCTKVILCGLVAGVAMVNAMPTLEQTKKVEPLVMNLMREDQNALKSGKKTRAEVAQSAMELADKAESEAAKLLLMKGAFHLYVRAGEFDRAIETLHSLQAAIPDMPPDNMVRIIESSLRVVSRKNGGQLYRLLDETKTRMRYTKEVETLEKSVKRAPSDRALRLKLAEHYAYLGKWDLALENFAAADGKVGAIAKSERDGKAATEKTADFWWNYPSGKADELVKCFRIHAAKLYEDAIANDDIKGLNKVQAERRIEEAKGYGENIFDVPKSGDGLYCVIDLSAGVNARRYPIRYLNDVPKGGWTDEYKGQKLVLRKVPVGAILINGQKKEFDKEFYAGVFEVTQKQFELVTGKSSDKNPVIYGFNRPVVNVDFGMIRGKGRGTSIDNDSFIGLLRKRTGLNIDLPTVSEWIYFGRAGLASPFNNGGSTEDDLKMLGRYKGNKNDGKGGYTDGPSAVGMYLPNAWGIYDIHGSVLERCLDNGKEAPIRNPKWGEDNFVEQQRVVMGRHWDDAFTKDQYTGWSWPLDAKKWYIGFRIVIQPEAYSKSMTVVTKQPTASFHNQRSVFKTGVKPGTITALKIANDCDIEFTYCPAGSMKILFKKPGDPSAFKKQTITHGYWLGCKPVSPAQWTTLMGDQKGLSESKGVALYISYENMQKYLETLNRRFSSKLPKGYEFRFPTSAEFSQAQAAMDESKDNPFWPVDANPDDWKNAKVIPDTPNPWGLELLGSFAHVLYDTVSCSDDEKSKGVADGTLVAWGGRPWYGFEERLPSKDPVLITPNGRPLTTGYMQEVYRKRCYLEPSGRVALRVCIGPKIK